MEWIMNASLFGTHVAAEPQNDFKPFAVGAEANVIDQSEYEKAAFLKDGFREGIARSSEINKAIRQGSSIATALARFAAAKTGEDILDNGDIDLLSRQIETAIGSVSSLLLAKAQGMPDAIVAGFTPAVRELKDGLLVHVRAEGANTATGPTFDADGTGARTIIKGNNLPLAMGDIAGTGHWLEMQYDEGLDKWILQNPAKGIIPQSGVPVGTVDCFATTTPPAGYLKADGAAVGRTTYPELFSAIGTTFGEGDGSTTFNLPDMNRELGAIVSFASLNMPAEYLLCDGRAVSRAAYAELFAVIGTTFGKGDGSTTFNLPDLIDRFAQGSNTPGQKVEAGLPNITGDLGRTAADFPSQTNGAFNQTTTVSANLNGAALGAVNAYVTNFDASRSNPIYGASDTVQPPATTVCYGIRAKNALNAVIKAFDAATNPGLIDITELANDIQKAKIAVGTVSWFAMSAPPVGYLVANGAAVGRETYPDLFAAIGTTFGEGDGETTFNLPDLIGRFAQGSTTPGQKIEAGLPNIEGSVSGKMRIDTTSGSFHGEGIGYEFQHSYNANFSGFSFDPSRSNPIYGNSKTVQPPALTLLPCIKAFDAVTRPGLIDVTELANEVANKADRNLSNVTNEGKSAVFEYCLPDYTAGVTKNVETEYTAATNGYIYVVAGNDGGVNQLVINDTTMNVSLISGGGLCQTSLLMPVSEGTRYKLIIGKQSGINGTVYTFYPLEGII